MCEPNPTCVFVFICVGDKTETEKEEEEHQKSKQKQKKRRIIIYLLSDAWKIIIYSAHRRRKKIEEKNIFFGIIN